MVMDGHHAATPRVVSTRLRRVMSVRGYAASRPLGTPWWCKKIFLYFSLHIGTICNNFGFGEKSILDFSKKVHFYGSKSLRKSPIIFFRLITISNRKNSFFTITLTKYLTFWTKENSLATCHVKISYQIPCNATLY